MNLKVSGSTMDRERLKRIVVDVIREMEDAPFITTGVSNRHIHLSRADMDALYGPAYQLTPVKELQPGQYASKETVAVSGPKGKFSSVRILGPVRGLTQFELSLSDTFALGVPCPVNESGNLSGAGRVRIENPASGAAIERDCAIVAMRHVHLRPETAGKYGLKDKQLVSLEYSTKGRRLVFADVLLRVSEKFVDEIHLDTDEANAGAIKNGDLGLIIAGDRV
ncbi:MAG: phosphate propanoyltransferase [Spirochaetaceae bacterium]|nr:phosphate propanoyltransferase [Spirochaetaceae bacterium]